MKRHRVLYLSTRRKAISEKLFLMENRLWYWFKHFSLYKIYANQMTFFQYKGICQTSVSHHRTSITKMSEFCQTYRKKEPYEMISLDTPKNFKGKQGSMALLVYCILLYISEWCVSKPTRIHSITRDFGFKSKKRSRTFRWIPTFTAAEIIGKWPNVFLKWCNIHEKLNLSVFWLLTFYRYSVALRLSCDLV